jgi:hypothetical protein
MKQVRARCVRKIPDHYKIIRTYVHTFIPIRYISYNVHTDIRTYVYMYIEHAYISA